MWYIHSAQNVAKHATAILCKKMKRPLLPVAWTSTLSPMRHPASSISHLNQHASKRHFLISNTKFPGEQATPNAPIYLTSSCLSNTLPPITTITCPPLPHILQHQPSYTSCSFTKTHCSCLPLVTVHTVALSGMPIMLTRTHSPPVPPAHFPDPTRRKVPSVWIPHHLICILLRPLLLSRLHSYTTHNVYTHIHTFK